MKKQQLDLPIYRHENTIGWYVFDDVKPEHYIITNSLHGLREKNISWSLDLLEISTDNQQTWTPVLTKDNNEQHKSK